MLEFYAVESPFSQPRNFVCSQIIATVVGVSYCKLFQLHSNADWVRWLGGALACATTTALTGLTKTVHPPAGATALIAVVDDRVVSIGWKLIPLVLLGCAVMLLVALLVNNIFGSFPLYWWSASGLTKGPPKQLSRSSAGEEEEQGIILHRHRIVILRQGVMIPGNIQISADERQVLENISTRL